MLDDYHFDLFKKYLDGLCTSAEKAEVEAWFESYEAGKKDFHNNDQEEISLAKARSSLAIQEKIGQYGIEQEVKVIPFKYTAILKWVSIAASVIFVIAIGRSFIQTKDISSFNASNQTTETDILPGKNKAILTLSNGKQIALDDKSSGVLANQGNVAIAKANKGQIVYHPINSAIPNAAADIVLYNTISTPKGGEWEVILPDGSHVFLNAATSITYPSQFTGKQRKIDLIGEAYFEIKKDVQKPFIVNIEGKQQIEVLGTHFNVEAFTEDKVVKTTLLEGSVKLYSQIKDLLLKPGQIAINDPGKSMQVNDADLDEVMAWRNGMFVFNYENITTIMDKISRWYDVEIEYKGNMQKVNLLGNYSRNRSLNKLLKYIQLTQKVHFEVEGRRVTVIAN